MLRALTTRSAAAVLAALCVTSVSAQRRTDAYPRSPRDVVEAYCAADFAGDQTASETWTRFARYAVWPDAPGWDTFTIVSGYTVEPRGRTSVRVVYHVLGALEGEEAREERRDKTVEYTLVRRGGRWKVASPQLEPHVSPEVALRIVDGLDHNRYVEGDHAKLAKSRELIQGFASATKP